MDLNGKRVTLLGGAGLIGSHIANLLVRYFNMLHYVSARGSLSHSFRWKLYCRQSAVQLLANGQNDFVW
jgi:nucleoside-diphosphate-sugar epimerase